MTQRTCRDLAVWAGRIPTQRLLACAACTLAAMFSASCASSGGDHTGSARPVVRNTAAETAGNADSSILGLSFFDELETRSLVAHDDALEGVLLLACGRGASNYSDRLMLTKALGLVDSSFDRPPREAATIGEVSRMVVRVLDRTGDELSQEQAVAKLVDLSILPPPARPIQGLTGAQLVSILGAADDQMRQGGIARLPLPTSQRTPETRQPALTGAGHAEPLPALQQPADMNSPTAAATAEREAATRRQIEQQLKAASLRDSAGKKPVWIPGLEQGSGSSGSSASPETPPASSSGPAPASSPK